MQITPHKTINPNCYRFDLTLPVNEHQKISYEDAHECDNGLAYALLTLPGVKKITIDKLSISVTKEWKTPWEDLLDDLVMLLYQYLPMHDPNFNAPDKDEENPPFQEYNEIKKVLKKEVIPYIKGHGGNIKLISYQNNVLTMHYQGSCTSCPSSQFETLEGITQILQEEYNPNIRVILEE